MYLLIHTTKFASGNTQHNGHQNLLLLKIVEKCQDIKVRFLWNTE